MWSWSLLQPCHRSAQHCSTAGNGPWTPCQVWGRVQWCINSRMDQCAYVQIMRHIPNFTNLILSKLSHLMREWGVFLSCSMTNFAQWRYSNQWLNREVLLLLVENYTQYPALASLIPGLWQFLWVSKEAIPYWINCVCLIGPLSGKDTTVVLGWCTVCDMFNIYRADSMVLYHVLMSVVFLPKGSQMRFHMNVYGGHIAHILTWHGGQLWSWRQFP